MPYRPRIQPNLAGLPKELLEVDHWLGAKFDADESRPKQPRTAAGTPARTNRREHFSPFVDIEKAIQKGRLDAPGFAVTAYDPFVLIDLDDCYDPSTTHLSDFARHVISALDTYTEVSLSGRGLHLICKSSLPLNYKGSPELRAKGKAIEFFAHKGYVLLTGKPLGDPRPVREIDPDRLQAFAEAVGATGVSASPTPPEPPEAELTQEHQFRLDEVIENDGYARMALTGEPDDLISAGDLREDQRPDGSLMVFNAARALKAAGFTAGETLAALRRSRYVQEEVLAAKGRAAVWLWRFGIGKVFAEEVPKAQDIDIPAAIVERRFLTSRELLAVPPEADEYLIEGVLPRRGVGELYGASGSYKSAIAMDWLLSVAYGRAWLGKAIHRPGPVLLIANEGHSGLPKRAQAWATERKLSGQLPEHEILWNPRGAVQVDPKGFPRLIEAEILPFGDQPPSLVVVDTLTLSLADGADENSATDIGSFLRTLGLTFPDSCVVAVHHTGKDLNKGPRGSSAGLANVDFAFKAEGTRALEARLTCSKQKDDRIPDAVDIAFLSVQVEAQGGITVSGLTASPEFIDNSFDAKLSRLKPRHADLAMEAISYLPHDGAPVKVTELIKALAQDGVGDWPDDKPGNEMRRQLINDLIEVGIFGSEGNRRGKTVSLLERE